MSESELCVLSKFLTGDLLSTEVLTDSLHETRSNRPMPRYLNLRINALQKVFESNPNLKSVKSFLSFFGEILLLHGFYVILFLLVLKQKKNTFREKEVFLHFPIVLTAAWFSPAQSSTYSKIGLPVAVFTQGRSVLNILDVQNCKLQSLIDSITFYFTLPLFVFVNVDEVCENQSPILFTCKFHFDISHVTEMIDQMTEVILPGFKKD